MRDEALFEQPAPLVVDRVGRGLSGVPEGATRVAYFDALLGGAPPKPMVRAVACALRSAARGEANARVFIDVFDTWLEQIGGPPAPEVLRAAAEDLEEHGVVGLLADGAGADAFDEPPKGSLAATGETLGRRRQIARVATGDTLDRLLLDPDPIVIRNVLLNGRVTEQLALRLTARRPSSGEIMEEIARSRFRMRPRIRKAIVMNPACPPGVATRMLALMPRDEVRQVAFDENLNEVVRAIARDVLAQKLG
jgi:hypothetical protein